MRSRLLLALFVFVLFSFMHGNWSRIFVRVPTDWSYTRPHSLVPADPISVPGAAEAATSRSGSIAMLDVRDLARVVRGAQAGVVTAFVLDPRGVVGRALIDACSNGHAIDIMLDGRSFVSSQNDRSIAAYNRAGCHARTSPTPIHMKLVYVNRRAFLSDENFSKGYVIEDLRSQDLSLIAQTLRGSPGYNDTFSTIKPQSLAIEAASIVNATGSLIIETESFGPDNPVAQQLERLAGHIPIKLLVANAEYSKHAEEREYVAALVSHGVDVRVTDATDKMAVWGDSVWIGSTNATAGVDDQVDWGLALRDGGIASSLRERFTSNWDSAERP